MSERRLFWCHPSPSYGWQEPILPESATPAEVLAEMGTLDLFIELERRGIAYVEELGHGMDRMLSHRVKSTDPWGINWEQPVTRVWKTAWVQPLPND